MGIISAQVIQTGLVGVLPSIAYINTTDTVAEVTTTGYLNHEVANGLQFSLPCIAAVATKATPSAAPQVGWYQVSHVGANWSLVVGSNDNIPLPAGYILVGNASNIAAAVSMYGQGFMDETGQFSLGNNTIVTTNIANSQVTLPKLAGGISPGYIIKLGGKDTSSGGSATVTITATGVAVSDLAFAAIQSSANAVSIQKVTAGLNQVTVVCSGDPGAATICWTAVRAAS